MTFSLTETFEDVLEYQGLTLSLDLSFDNVLRMFQLFGDDTFSEREKVDISLEILLSLESHENVESLDYTAKHSLFLYLMREFLDIDLESNDRSVEKPSFDWVQDAGLIYSSFLNAYQMDLFKEQGKLHWKKFLQLFHNLPEKTRMKEAIMYRVMDIPAPTRYNSDDRKRIIAMKKMYKLKQSETEELQLARNEQNMDNFANALLARCRG